MRMRETVKPWPHDAQLLIADRLPAGEAGTDRTIAAMIAAIRHDAAHPGEGLRLLNEHLLYTLRGYQTDAGSRSRMIYRLVREAISFRRDPPGVELLRTPNQIADDIVAGGGKTVGDCDESSALVAALSLMAKMRPVLVVCARTHDGPYVHVFAGVIVGGRIWAMDAQEGFWGDWPACAKAKVYEV